jgi:hypothetical protein
MVNFSEIAAGQQHRQLGRIDFVVVVPVGTYKLVAARVGYDETINFLMQVSVKPAGHRAFFDGYVLFAVQ